jgi:hypothetical protein
MELIFGPSPEASGPIRQIVFGLTLEVSEYRKHAGGSFPGDLTFHVEVPHSVARSFVVTQDVSDQLVSREVGIVFFLVFVGAIDPKPESLFHAKVHWVSGQRMRRVR